jgi:hypothetical protein
LEYQRIENRLSSLDTVLEQEREYIQIQVSKILPCWRPDVMLVEKSVARLAQDMLREAGVTLVLNVKQALMQRIARATRAVPIVPASDYIDKCASIGTCGKFVVETYISPQSAVLSTTPAATATSSPASSDVAVPSADAAASLSPSPSLSSPAAPAATDSSSSSAIAETVASGPTDASEVRVPATSSKVIVMSFEECAPRFHATILLRGASSGMLKRVKYILRMCIHVAYHLSLEAALLFDECATYPEQLFERMQLHYHAKIAQIWGANSVTAQAFQPPRHLLARQQQEGGGGLSLALFSRQLSRNNNNSSAAAPPLPSCPPPMRSGYSIPLSSSPFIDMSIVPIPQSIIDARRLLQVGVGHHADSSSVLTPPSQPSLPPLWIHDAILFGSTWFSAEFQCFPPECKGIQFYTATDKTLGSFLLENCFDLKLRCLNEKCNRDVLRHTLAYTHAQGRIVISVKKIRKRANHNTLLFSPHVTQAAQQQNTPTSTRGRHSARGSSPTPAGSEQPSTPWTLSSSSRATSGGVAAGTLAALQQAHQQQQQHPQQQRRHPLEHPSDIMMWSRCKLCARRVTPYMVRTYIPHAHEATL